MKKIIAVACLCSLLWAACNQLGVVTFKEAQPAGVQPLSAFPKRLQGQYLDREGRAVLSIYDSRMIITEDYDFGSRIKDLDSVMYSLRGDTLYDHENDSRQKVMVKGDSIWQHIHHTDTLFDLANREQVAKQFKGYCFLNWNWGDEGWTIMRLSLQKGQLHFAAISDSTAVAQLKTLTEQPQDTVTYPYSISKKQFKTFNHYGFTDADTFYRISK